MINYYFKSYLWTTFSHHNSETIKIKWFISVRLLMGQKICSNDYLPIWSPWIKQRLPNHSSTVQSCVPSNPNHGSADIIARTKSLQLCLSHGPVSDGCLTPYRQTGHFMGDAHVQFLSQIFNLIAMHSPLREETTQAWDEERLDSFLSQWVSPRK